MKFYLPKPITLTDSNIGDNLDENGNAYTLWSKTSGYNKGQLVKYGQNTYTALTTVYPLAHYIWEDLIVTAKYAYNLHTETIVADPTAVPIVNGETVVYVRSLNKWYLAKVTGNVDFTAENPAAPSNFNEITGLVPYRIDLAYPSGVDTTLYWEYSGVANKFRAFDSAIGTQTAFDDQIYYKFTANAISAVSFMYVQGTTVRVKGTDAITLEVLYDETITMIDTSHLDTYEKVCTLEARQLTEGNVYMTVRYQHIIEVWVTNTGAVAKIGALKAGQVDSLGKTLDDVGITNKSYNEVTQRSNGEYVWNAENKESNKVFSIRYNLSVETAIFDAMILRLKEITDKEVVLIGDDSDSLQFRTLLNYGAIKSSSGDLRTNFTQSRMSIEIENFV